MAPNADGSINLEDVILNDFGPRLRSLEQNQSEILPLLGKMAEVGKTFENLRDDILEIKGDIKDISKSQSEMTIKVISLGDSVKVLEEDRLARLDSKKNFKRWAAGVVGSVIAAAIIWYLKLK